MHSLQLEQLVRKLDMRVTRIEQLLPTLATKSDLQEAVARLATKEELREAVAKLATKEELREAVAKLATKEELRAEVAKLATKDEMKAGFEDAKRYALILVEATRDEIRMLAEHILAMREQLDRMNHRLEARNN